MTIRTTRDVRAVRNRDAASSVPKEDRLHMPYMLNIRWLTTHADRKDAKQQRMPELSDLEALYEDMANELDAIRCPVARRRARFVMQEIVFRAHMAQAEDDNV